MGYLLIFCICSFMAKVADGEGKSGLIWGVITFVVCFFSTAIPLPFLNLLIGGAISFGLMILSNVLFGKKA